ncbi:transcription repressor OFP6-like [Salvia miltiorrhiza]|uniref:transcription repressor OFP6-like n=1 Tax=Salvia miltiorrhiza TaxID=226208 RepID=UPI0025AD313A|nr:transcription repressor OFP6-like [Salvia miltiorrhiza]
MSSAKKKHILNTVSVKLGCRPSLSAFFRRKLRQRHHPHNHKSSSSSSFNTATTFSSSAVDTPLQYSSDPDSEIKSQRAVQGFGRLGGQSVAVEKDSDDPYLDFRRSMLQMILERELYSKDDLKELLNCFLQLNSPYYHGLIVRAFKEIWSAAAVCPSPSPNTLGAWTSGDYF